MTVLLGDPIRYSISGFVQQADEMKEVPTLGGIKARANVEVATSCKGAESSLYQNRRVLTDEDGQYRLKGYGLLEGCSISFNHKDYQPAAIVINESHLVRSVELVRIYQVNVQLMRRTTGQ